MQIADITCEARQPGNRRANRHLRERGLVPAVIYGHGEDPETVSLSRHDIEIALAHLQHVINLRLGRKRKQYLIKEVQYDHLQKTPIHVDLMRVDPNERVRVKVPVELRGEPHGIHEGGELVQVIADLEIECRLVEIPEEVRPDVAHLGVGQALHIGELTLPEGITALGEDDEIVAVVRAKRGVTADELEEVPELAGEESGKQPEVIGRAAKEQAGETGG